MTIDPTTAIPPTPIVTTPSPTPTTQANDTLGQDAFLKLMIAQLKYQDPMDPVKGAEFIAQTAQFTSVEKLDEMSKLTTEMVMMQRLSQAGSMVGRTVAYTDSDGAAQSGVVSSATLNPSGPVLRVGDADVPIINVTEVRVTAPVTS
jgi:flagellar basal-body rod modification protein FlgD